MIDRDEKIKEIKKSLYDPRNNLFKQIGDTFISNYIEYKNNGNKDTTLSIKDYMDEIKPYLNDVINDHKTQGEWKIKLTMKINFFSSRDSKETRTVYSHSDNIEVIIGTETDKIIEDLFDSFLQRYQKDLEESVKGSGFVFDNVDSLYYKLHKISVNIGGSYIDSPKWLKNKKAAIKPKK